MDGNDVLAVLAATRFALNQARTGGGPTLIEAVTYRMGPHTTSDDPNRYRDRAELDGWRVKDPIERVRLLLEREGLLDDEQAAEVAATADDVAARLREGCITTADPSPESLFEHVYATAHPRIDDQRSELTAHLASFTTAEGSVR